MVPQIDIPIVRRQKPGRGCIREAVAGGDTSVDHMKVVRRHPFDRFSMNVVGVFLTDIPLVIKLRCLDFSVIDGGMPGFKIHFHPGARHQSFRSPETNMAGCPHNIRLFVKNQLVGLKIKVSSLQKGMAIGMDQMRPVIEADMVRQNRNLVRVWRSRRRPLRSKCPCAVHKAGENGQQKNGNEMESCVDPPVKSDGPHHDGGEAEVRSPACRGESSPASHFWTPATR